MAKSRKELTAKEAEGILKTLEARFLKNTARHKGIDWNKVKARLEKNPSKLWSLDQMEETGGEPDVVGTDKSGGFIFFDCSPESPAGRRSLCYDREGLDARKEHKPRSSAMEMAMEMGIEMLTEDQYRDLQKLGKFDTKTSSWIKTPDKIRKLGGALFADYRFGMIFIYHNTAPSYYAARGFRGCIIV